MSMNEERKKEIISTLQSKGANLFCPRCDHPNFTLIEGYFNQSLQTELTNNLIIGGVSVPSVGVICNQCGFISHHALGVLGLMPKQTEENKDTKNVTE